MLNGEVAQTIALPKEQAGSALIREVSIDPRLVSDFNRLSLQFIGHYTLDCGEDPFIPACGWNVSNLSSLQFTVTPLAVVNDGALLPVPFLTDAMAAGWSGLCFRGTPSVGTLEAAGIVASWFGDMASYRGRGFQRT